MNSDGEEDAHIADLSRRVRALIELEGDGEAEGKDGGVAEVEGKAVGVVGRARGGNGSVDEQEETEKAI